MSRLCRLRNASHGDDGQWAYSEIVGLREQVEKLKTCLSHYAVYQTSYGTKNAAAKLLEELK